MSYNGSGTFVINTAGQPVVSGTVISSTAFNALTADLATGLSTAITKDGQTTPTANIPMGNNKITGLAVGTAATDAANLSQVQSTTAKLINSISGTDTITGTMSPTLGAYATGQMFYFIAAGDNTGAVTLNIDSLGAKAVTRDGSVALAASDLKSGEVVVVVYDGTRFQVVSQLNSAGDARFANVSIASALNVGGVATFTGGTANGVTYLNGSKALTSGSALVFDGTNLGIGTSSPTDTGGFGRVVDVQGSTGAQVVCRDSDDTTKFARLSFDGGTTNVASIGVEGTDTQVAFRAGGGEKMRLTAAGSLGLGTNAPDAPLHIAKSSATSGVVINAQNSTTGSLIQFACPGVANLRFGAPNADAFVWQTFGSGSYPEQMRLTSTGLGIGTNSPSQKLEVAGAAKLTGTNLAIVPSTTTSAAYLVNTNAGGNFFLGIDNSTGGSFGAGAYGRILYSGGAYPMVFFTNDTERARITSDGELLIGQSVTTAPGAGNDVNGMALRGTGIAFLSASSSYALSVGRNTNDGELVRFYQAGTQEGDISVSGTTVSYNGGHLSRYSQTTDNTQIPLVKGTVMSNLDQMAVWEKDGEPLPNEQLNCMKVSDVEGDLNVAGVFVNWNYDEEYGTNDMNVAMTGDMIIRIAQGVVVQRGDLLMSAGDGTAKPQGDDIIRSKTVAKVTSNHVTCTYEDGSYCVPCVLMAC